MIKFDLMSDPALEQIPCQKYPLVIAAKKPLNMVESVDFKR
jgi:hypothetical protein